MFLFSKPCHPSGGTSYKYRWSIENFGWYYSPNGRLRWKDFIESEKFTPEGSKLDFKLRLYPRGNECDSHAALELRTQRCLKSDSSDEEVNLKLTFAIEDGVGQKHFQETVNHNFDRNDRFVCKQFIGLADLERDKKNLLPKETLTICCEIECIDYWNGFYENTQTESVSQPNLLSHSWTIDHFTEYLKDERLSWKEVLYSPPFSSSNGNIEFYLSLYPNENGDQNKDHLSVYLHLSEESDVKFNCAFWLKDHLKSVIGRALSKNEFGYSKYISHSNLKNFANNYLPQNKLTIAVHIENVGNELIRGYYESTAPITGLSHEWTIEDFPDYLNRAMMRWRCEKKKLYSEEFSTRDGNFKFAIRLNPIGEVYEDHISVYLCLNKYDDRKRNLNYTFSVIDSNGRKCNIQAGKTSSFYHARKEYGFSQYLSHGSLLYPENNFLSQNKLTIRVDFKDDDSKLIQGNHETYSITKSNIRLCDL